MGFVSDETFPALAHGTATYGGELLRQTPKTMRKDNYIAAVRRLIHSTSMDAADREALLHELETHGHAVANPPDEPLPEVCAVLNATMLALLARAEQLYGHSQDEHPALVANRHGTEHPVVAPDCNDHRHYCALLNSLANTWEEAFYALAHEVVHLLNPVPTESDTVATLEEGVAIAFAESVYAEYITPYTGRGAQRSPIRGEYSSYIAAYEAAALIPASTLLRIRKTFGSFAHAMDEATMLRVCGREITEKQARLLSSPFEF